MSDEHDTKTETDRPSPPSMADVFHLLEDVAERLARLERVPDAVQTLGTRLTGYYEREAERRDQQDRRLDALERRLETLEGVGANGAAG